MKQQNAKFEGIIKKAVTHMVETELYEWPPKCTAFLYQPVRPKKTEKKQTCGTGEMQE